MGKLEKEFEKYAKQLREKELNKNNITNIIEGLNEEKKISIIASELFAILQYKLSEVHTDKQLTKFLNEFMDLDEGLTEDFKFLYKNDKHALNKKIANSCLITSNSMLNEDRNRFETLLARTVEKRIELGMEL